MYCYNPRTNKLHLSNCRYIKNNGTDFKQYGTENDVNIDIGQEYVCCKICKEEREKIISKATK